jgi:hypothetical protein
MKRTIMLVALAVVALSAVLASAASALPAFNPGAFTFTGESGTGTLTTLSGFTITCKSDTILEGSVSGGTTFTVGDVHFKGCTFLGLEVNTKGDAAGIILLGKLKGSVCYISKAEKKVGAFLELEKTVVIEAVGSKSEVKGSLVGELKPVNTKTKAYTLVFSQSKGDASQQCEGKTASLLTKTPTGKEFEGSGLGGEDKLTASIETTLEA